MANGETSKVRILVIEDDAAIRRMIYRILNEEGHEVFEAAHGKEGMKLLAGTPGIDVVITDIIMPEKEGMEVLQELRENYPEIKTMAISGGGKLSAHDYLSLAKVMGADIVLSKPFVRRDLVDALHRLTD